MDIDSIIAVVIDVAGCLVHYIDFFSATMTVDMGRTSWLLIDMAKRPELADRGCCCCCQWRWEVAAELDRSRLVAGL